MIKEIMPDNLIDTKRLAHWQEVIEGASVMLAESETRIIAGAAFVAAAAQDLVQASAKLSSALKAEDFRNARILAPNGLDFCPGCDEFLEVWPGGLCRTCRISRRIITGVVIVALIADCVMAFGQSCHAMAGL